MHIFPDARIDNCEACAVYIAYLNVFQRGGNYGKYSDRKENAVSTYDTGRK